MRCGGGIERYSAPDRTGHRMSDPPRRVRLAWVIGKGGRAGVPERLNQAMEYIERRLDQRIEAAELARTAVTSEYHFRRLWIPVERTTG